MKPENCQANQGFDRRAIPPDAVESHWTGEDGHRIRRLDWPISEGAVRGSLLFMPGRSDFYEKYLETLHHWHCRSWHVSAADWRGQAKSGRLGADAKTGHVDDFAIWVDDLADLWQAWRDSTQGPHVLVAHSMGGHIALRALAEGRVDPDAMVLTAPMLGLLPGLDFIPKSWRHRFARFMASRGDPRRPAWSGSERSGWSSAKRFERLTHDRERYADESWWRARHPEFNMGAPSWGWIEAGLHSALRMGSPGFLEAIDRPLLMLATRFDRLVEATAIEQAAGRIAGAQCAWFGEEARHELLREEDSVRDKVLDVIDEFLDSRAPAEGKGDDRAI